jgi:hypothetical protein
MCLLVTLLLDRERAHNKSIIHVINRKSEFIKNMPTSSVFNDLALPYDLYGKYDNNATIDGTADYLNKHNLDPMVTIYLHILLL